MQINITAKKRNAGQIYDEIKTKYDTNATLLYKWSKMNNIPTRLVVVHPRKGSINKDNKDVLNSLDGFELDSIPNYIHSAEYDGIAIKDAFDTLKQWNKNITKKDVAYTLFEDEFAKQDRKNEAYLTATSAYNLLDDGEVMVYGNNTSFIGGGYKPWAAKNTKILIKESQRLEKITNTQKKLMDIGKTGSLPAYTPLVINSNIHEFTPSWLSGDSINAEDGLDVYNSAVVSQHVSFLKYNDAGGNPYIKIYKSTQNSNSGTNDKKDKKNKKEGLKQIGGVFDGNINYNNVVIAPEESPQPNTIYMTLWVGNKHSDIGDANKDSFYTILYKLDTNTIRIESPDNINPKKGFITDPIVAHDRIRKVFPKLNLGPAVEVNVKGLFEMYDKKADTFDNITFVDMMLNDLVLSTYLYIEELNAPFGLKKRLDVHYKSLYGDLKQKTKKSAGPLLFTLSKKINKDGDKIVNTIGSNNKPTKTEIKNGAKYLKIAITQSASKQDAKHFLELFQHLLKYYFSYNTQSSKLYFDTYLPELKALDELKKIQKKAPLPVTARMTPEAQKKDQGGCSNINSLQDIAPDLFVLNYARKCQCKLQPKIIEDHEIEGWKNKKIKVKVKSGAEPEKRIVKEIERQVMVFPDKNDKRHPNGPRWNFVCPNDENPYPGLKVNTDLSNKELYPYIICCSKTDKMTVQIGTNKYKTYYNYTHGIDPIEKKGAKAEDKISTRKMLIPERIAYLPVSVEKLLKKYSDASVDMVRYGVPRSINSMIHCICIAIDDPNYMKFKTEEEKEIYTIGIRNYMADDAVTNPELLKQELFDHTNDEIMHHLGNPDTFLDPDLFYRAMEEIFGINIYVFTNSAITTDLENGEIVFPRFQMFHSRPKRLYRPTVILMRSLGSESDALEYPQCELIVDYDTENKEIIKLFGKGMTEICHRVLFESMKTITWSGTNKCELTAYSNIYYYIDHLYSIPYEPVSQYIDENGKCRSITFNIKNSLVTLHTLPCQPENIPSKKEHNASNHLLVESIFGIPNAVTHTDNGRYINGYWYSILDIHYGEYISVIPYKSANNKFEEGPKTSHATQKHSLTDRYRTLQHVSDLITQIIQWLYAIEKNNNIDATPAKFAKTYFVVTNGKNVDVDSATFYNLFSIKRKLPTQGISAVQSAMKTIDPGNQTNLFSKNGHIVLYDADFRKRMLQMLIHYEQMYSNAMPHYRILFNALENQEDFVRHRNTKLFMNLEDLNYWLISNKITRKYGKYYGMHKTISHDLKNFKQPYVFKDDDEYYLIQNSTSGGVTSKEKSIETASRWWYPCTNPKYGKMDKYMVYGIASSLHIIPIFDNTQGDTVYMKILYYGSIEDFEKNTQHQYAAMLPIL